MCKFIPISQSSSLPAGAYFFNSLQFLKRLEVREKYNIKGDLVTDVLFSACCACCSLIQVEKEVIARQSGASAEGYVAPATMVAAPQ